MTTVIATFTVKPENAAEFEAVFAELQAATKANEPNVSIYVMAKNRKVEGQYKILERYGSKDDFKFHGESEWFKAAFAKMNPLFAEPPVLEILDTVA